MSDRISQLAENTAPAADDELAIVDKSDTTDSVDGTTKRVTVDTLRTPPNGYLYAETVYFTSSDTFDKADYSWLRAVRVKVQGAGGGGGGCNAPTAGQIAGGGGGGGGGYAEAFVLAGSLATSETVTVGAGGAGGAAGTNNGSSGGASSFGSHAAANGATAGDGGAADTPTFVNAAPGLGGDATAGDFQTSGEDGYRWHTIADIVGRVIGARGGSSMLGFGGRGVYTATAQPGEAGKDYGGGGAGGVADQSSTAQAGGGGGDGIVIVELYA